MSNFKGGPGSGPKPGAHNNVRVPGTGRVQIGGPSRPIGVKPSAAFPHGRHPDGSPRTSNDMQIPKAPKK